MKALKLTGLLAFIIMSSFSSCELLWYHNEQKLKVYNLALSFQDASGNNLVKGIGLSSWCCGTDIPAEQAQSGIVERDLYALDIMTPCKKRPIAPGRYDDPAIGMLKYNDSYFLTFDYAHLEDECPAIEEITFQLKCPYVFGDDEKHEIITFWKADNSETGMVCYRIEFGDKVITEIVNEFNDLNRATILLER
ncbi:MAG: hypothetical protein LBE91_07815 [Tannerella sp.]|jgi:hypothetical protein|nr:hypothetical protein [Tannerella sp.]